MTKDIIYKKVEIDNLICKRRFHIAYEEGTPTKDLVKIQCPHCSDVIYEKKNHPYAELIREENLTHEPDGTKPLMSHCQFKPL
jgi:hypothetical protein